MDENTPEVAKNGNRLMRFFGHPLVGMISCAAPVVSLFLSVYFYLQNNKKPDLVYYVNPAQAVVVKTGEASSLQVLFGGQELKSDVTAAQVAVWNRGNDSVRPERVLEQIVIRTDPPTPILEASVRKKSRDVVNLSLDQSKLNLGEVGVKWNILEQGDGAIIQLVFAGPPTTLIKATGVIEGQRQIHELSGPTRKTDPSGEPNIKISHKQFGIIIIMLGILGPLSMSPSTRKLKGRPGAAFRISSITIAIMYTGLGLFMIFFWPSPGPPFGF